MARPDPTPPDASLFPIAPTYTADLDARALDSIASYFIIDKRLTRGADDKPRALALLEIVIRKKVHETGREV